MYRTHSLLRTAAGVLVALCLLPGRARAQDLPLGPLTFEDGSPLQRIALTPSMESADPVEPGRWRAELWLGYANIFEQDSSRTHVLFLDLEQLLTTVTVRRGLTPGLEVGGRLTLETTGGGILDDFVSGWHQAFGLQNANREKYPSNQYAQLLRDERGALRLDVPRRTFHPDDVRLFAKWRLAGGGAPDGALSLRGVVRVPTADNRAGREGTDVALLALGRTRWGSVHLHGMLGAATVRAGGALKGVVRDASWYLTVGAEQRLASWISALGQISLATPKVRGFEDSEIDGAASNLILGFGGRWAGGWRWEASFQEDIPPNTPSVDFTLGLGLRRTF